MGTSILAICVGASLGALLRWWLGLGLNALFPAIPPGTLAANLVGGYLIGVAMAAFSHHVVLPPEWRLFVITGFLGGLTTFSSFSMETTLLLQQGRVWLACVGVGLHVVGSVLLTLAGIASYEGLRRWL